MSVENATAPRSSRGKVIWLVVLGIVVLLIAAVAWVGLRGVMAKSQLDAAIPLATGLPAQIVAGDTEAARSASDELSEHATSAAELTSDPIWRAAELVPWAGANLTAVRELAAVVDDVAHDAVAPLTEIAGGVRVDDFKPVDGVIDVQPLVDAQPGISAASTAMKSAEVKVKRIDAAGTIGPVSDAVARLRSTVEQAASALDGVDRAVRLAPAMLGTDEPRNYVLLFQNPAELRASGGIAGALALIHTEGGRMTLTQQASTSDFPRFPEPVLELPEETLNLYGDDTGQFIQDVNLTPRFDLTGPLAKEMWLQRFGVDVDGVLSVDPIALSYILRATGPITLPTGDVISSDNAVRLLLVDVYARYERPVDQDAFFAAAAAAVFSSVAGGGVDPSALIDSLAEAGDQYRILVWSARDDEQAILADTTLAGTLPRSDADTMRFGVFLNDGTAAKMDTYLETRVELGQATCRGDERPNYLVRVTLTNTAPADAATSLPSYVTGSPPTGLDRGGIRTIVVVYGQEAMTNLGVLQNGEVAPFQPTTDSGRPVSSIPIGLSPGESTTLEFGWLGAEPFSGDLAARATPAINPIETESVEISCESGLW